MIDLRRRLALAALALCITPVALSAQSSLAVVVDELKVGENLGGFVGPLPNDGGFGDTLATIGDIDGNGVPDIVVGAAYGNTNCGAVWVLRLDSDGSVIGEQRISDGVGGFTGEFPFGDTYFGAGVAAVGDVNGDGVPDIAVASTLPESVWILMLNSDGTVSAHEEIPYGGLISGSGTSLSLASIGDLDGNGAQDLVLGLPTGAGFGTGVVWLLRLDTDGSLLSTTQLFVPGTGLFIGIDVARVGDLDGNGVTEIAYVSLGQLSIAFLESDGSVLHTAVIAEDTGGFSGPLNPQAVAPMGDLDGDGVPDLAVSVGGANTVWLFYMNTDGTIRYTERIGLGEGGFGGTLAPFDRFGSGLTLLGDLDGDGTLELAVGANGTATFPGMFPGVAEGVVWILSLQDTWFDQGFELAGGSAAPLMVGEGSLDDGSVLALSISGGTPSANVLVFTGASAIDAPFKQGLLVPAPDIARVFAYNGAGELNLVTHWPAGVPSGFRFFLQAWQLDGGAPAGFAASNALLGQTP